MVFRIFGVHGHLVYPILSQLSELGRRSVPPPESVAEVRRRRHSQEARPTAGSTGIELAGIIAELANVSLWPSFRNIATREARILLIEAGPRVLAAFREDLLTQR